MRHLTRILCTMLLLGAPLFAASAQAVSDSASIQAAELDYGLHIVSYPAHSDQFTGLALEDGKAIPVKGKTLEMSFNLFNRPDNVFGCIFRIITDKGDNVDLMYTADLQDARKLILVTGDQVHFIATEIPMEQWFPVRIGLNTKDGTIDLDYNGAKFSVRDAGTKGAKTFRISFGLCQLAGYTLGDVASVNVRDINLSLGGKPFPPPKRKCTRRPCSITTPTRSWWPSWSATPAPPPWPRMCPPFTSRKRTGNTTRAINTCITVTDGSVTKDSKRSSQGDCKAVSLFFMRPGVTHFLFNPLFTVTFVLLFRPKLSAKSRTQMIHCLHRCYIAVNTR